MSGRTVGAENFRLRNTQPITRPATEARRAPTAGRPSSIADICRQMLVAMCRACARYPATQSSVLERADTGNMRGSTAKRAAAMCAGALAVHFARNCYAVHAALKQHTREARDCAREAAARATTAHTASPDDGTGSSKASAAVCEGVCCPVADDTCITAQGGVPVPTGDAAEAVSEEDFKKALQEVAARMSASDTVSPLDR